MGLSLKPTRLKQNRGGSYSEGTCFVSNFLANLEHLAPFISTDGVREQLEQESHRLAPPILIGGSFGSSSSSSLLSRKEPPIFFWRMRRISVAIWENTSSHHDRLMSKRLPVEPSCSKTDLRDTTTTRPPPAPHPHHPAKLELVAAGGRFGQKLSANFCKN